MCIRDRYFSSLSQDKMQLYSSFVANSALFSIITGFLIAGFRRHINMYETFIEGAKDGFKTAVTIIPYLVAILVSIGIFRASGAMDFLVDGISAAVAWCGLDTDFVGALPTAIMKPLSGSGCLLYTSRELSVLPSFITIISVSLKVWEMTDCKHRPI